MVEIKCKNPRPKACTSQGAVHGLGRHSRRTENPLAERSSPEPWQSEVVVALCDKDGPFVAPFGRSRGIYEFEEEIWVCSEVTTE